MGGFERGVNIKRFCSKSRRGQLGESFERHLTQNNGNKQLAYICKVGLQALQLHYPYFTNKQAPLPHFLFLIAPLCPNKTHVTAVLKSE